MIKNRFLVLTGLMLTLSLTAPQNVFCAAGAGVGAGAGSSGEASTGGVDEESSLQKNLNVIASTWNNINKMDFLKNRLRTYNLNKYIEKQMKSIRNIPESAKIRRLISAGAIYDSLVIKIKPALMKHLIKIKKSEYEGMTATFVIARKGLRDESVSILRKDLISELEKCLEKINTYANELEEAIKKAGGIPVDPEAGPEE
jgi:hypothetical protein